MKKKSILMGLSVPLVLTLLVGCGGNKNPTDGTTITLWAAQTKYNKNTIKDIVDEYNKGQGVLDKVYVKVIYKTKETAQTLNHGALDKNPTEVDIHPLYDEVMIKAIEQKLFENLDPYFENETYLTKDANGNRVLNLEDFSDNSLDRFRLNYDTKYTGKGEHLYALAQLSNPAVLYYNEDFFKQEGFNIISIAEKDLANYNATNGTSFMPTGYAEYKTAPAPGLTVTGSGDEAVYRVFNNQIAMSWAELDYVGGIFTKSYNAASPSQYGFLSEYWFPFGWSVGGDCIALNPATDKYKFTLTDKLSNYLVIDDNVTIGSDTYNKGDLVNYRSRLLLDEHKADPNYTTIFEKLNVMPSQYDSFAHFCSLTAAKGSSVDATVKGLGISPLTTEISGSGSKIQYFTARKTAMVVEGFDQLNLLKEGMTDAGRTFNVAKMIQYREFVGGEVDSNGKLKVIGKDYGGDTFTGEIKVSNTGVKIVGKSTSSARNIGWGIPKNSAHKVEAFKFLQYWCSKDVQVKLAKVNDGVPTIPSVTSSAEYKAITMPFKNTSVLNHYEVNSQIGDWSYLGDKDWVNNWSEDLNNGVRNGTMTLTKFINKHETDIDAVLATYAYKIHGKE